jgi:DNA polymerase-3 subunit delta
VSIHLVKGDDPVLRVDALERLISDLLDGADRTMALEEYEVPARGAGADPDAGTTGGGAGGGADARQAVVELVLNAAATPPFMTDRRVVVLRDVGLLAAAEVEPLVRSFDDPLDTTELVLVAGGGRTPKALEDAVKRGGRAHVPEATKPVDVLARELEAAGLELRADAAKSVLAHVGNDAGLIPAIVETLAAAHGDDSRPLEVEQVTPYLVGGGATPVWDLTNAIEKGEPATALAVLHRMLTVTSPTQPKPMHPLQVLGVLHSQYRKLLALDDPAIRSAEDAAEALGGRTSPNAARFRLRQARALGTDGLRRAFDLLARADLDLKGERAIPEGVVMELLVARLAALSARAGAGRSARS